MPNIAPIEYSLNAHALAAYQLTYQDALSDTLANDLANNIFTVWLQPQVNLEDEKICGAEALIRKIDGRGNILPPLSFISLYEQLDLIDKVDLFVFETICKFLKNNHLSISRFSDFTISVNFSRLTISKHNIIKDILKLCERYNVNPKQIVIEVTETIKHIDLVALKKRLNEFKDHGFKISLDDFGTGFSNMDIMTAVDFDEIKIDRSLVINITENKKSHLLTKFILTAIEEFQDNTLSLAEGIENKLQLDLLKKMNCQRGQGYLFARPLPIYEFMDKYLA